MDYSCATPPSRATLSGAHYVEPPSGSLRTVAPLQPPLARRRLLLQVCKSLRGGGRSIALSPQKNIVVLLEPATCDDFPGRRLSVGRCPPVPYL
jgi:hypothetical protein